MTGDATVSQPVHFLDDDDAYLRWLAEHPRGYVINCYRDPTPDYLILHRATCILSPAP